MTLSKQERELLRQIGRRTGKLGGLAAARNMTAQQRHDRAMKAISTRYANKHKEANNGKGKR